MTIDHIQIMPGHRLRMVRAYPGKDSGDAIARASRKAWWPRRKSDAPVASRGWWCWALNPARSAP